MLERVFYTYFYNPVRKKYFNNNLSFNLKLINIICIGSLATTLMNSIMAICWYDSKVLIALNIFLLLLTSSIFVYTNRTKNYKLGGFIACIVVNLFALPCLFFASAGIISSIPSYFIFGIVLSLMMLEGKRLAGMVILETITYALCYFGYFHFKVTPLEKRFLKSEMLYSYMGVVTVSIIIGLIFYNQIKIYRKKQVENEKQRQMLRKSVENIIYAKQEAENAKKEAEEANQAKSEFLAHMSHEIRTPMNAILGIAELITRLEISDEVHSKIQSIQRAAESLLAIINDILDLSKIESGKVELTEATYYPEFLINDVIKMVSSRLETKPIKLEVHIEESIPSELKGDETRIRQIMINILTNAIKYTQEGTITLDISWKQKGDKALVRISVKDTGIGIKEEDMKRLFLEFERLDMKNNYKIEGTGLGLRICKQLVELMQGTIEVRSIYQVGSEFIVTLPQTIINLEPTQESPTWDREKKPFRYKFIAPQARVLIVDDNAINLEVEKGLIAGYEFIIDTADSGAACLEALRKEHYNLVFLDHMMPEMSGIETLHIIREQKELYNQDIPFIALTANAIAGNREMFIKEGFSEYISKPIEIRKLHNILLKFLPQELIYQVKEPSIKEKKIALNIPGINIEVAMQNVNQDMKLYLSILGIYKKEMEQRIQSLQTVYRGDLKEFEIAIHGIKGSSTNVGATLLAEKAETLELAAHQRDEDYIKERIESFICEMEELLKSIEAFLERHGSKSTMKKGKEATIDSKLLSRLEKSFKEMDLNQIISELEKIKSYSYDDATEELIKKLEVCAEEIEYAEGMELINRWHKEKRQEQQV